MSVRKYRSVEEMEGNAWREPGAPDLFRAIRATWDFARRTLRPSFPPGLYRHRSLEDAQKLRAEWEGANFRAYRRRLVEKAEEEEPSGGGGR